MVKFYFDLEESLKDIPRKDMKMIVGDSNAKVGKDCTGWKGVIGRYGYGERNERGEKLFEFVSKYNMTRLSVILDFSKKRAENILG